MIAVDTNTLLYTQVGAWLDSPALVLLAETEDHWRVLSEHLETGQIVGPRVHDARLDVLCISHTVSAQWTLDRDFFRFLDLRTANPLTD